MDIKAIRFKNLELLIDQYGSAEIARKAGSSPAYISQIKTKRLTPKGEKIRGIGDDIARRIEKGFEKPTGWLDQIHYKADRQKYHDMLDALDNEELLRFEKALELAGFSRDIKTIDRSTKHREDKPSKSA